MRWIAPLVLLVIPCFAEDTARPSCNAQNRGRLWPEQANTDPAFARQAGRCGELRMCSLGVWKYDWAPLTVHITQLGKARNREILGCGQQAGKATGPPVDRSPIGQSARQPSEGETGEQVDRPQSRWKAGLVEITARE